MALLFVAISLGSGFLTEKRAAATRIPQSRRRAAAMIAAEHKDSRLVLAGALLLLLIVDVRNAWDLTLSMIRR